MGNLSIKTYKVGHIYKGDPNTNIIKREVKSHFCCQAFSTVEVRFKQLIVVLICIRCHHSIYQYSFQYNYMKHNVFKIKIRKLGEPIQAKQLSQIEGFSRKAPEIDQLKATVQQTNEKMLELMTLFETFMKTSIQQASTNLKAPKCSPREDAEREVRDRHVHLPLPESETVSKQEQEKWMTDVCIATFSTSFHYYLTEQMTFEQTKVFCSENILRNMLQFTERFKLTDKEIENLNSHIGRKVLEYLQKKYPLTQSNDVNKALEKQVQQTNHLDLLTNDFLYFAGIMFKYSPDGNYNDTVMRVINKAIEIAEQSSLMSDYLNEGRKEETNYSDFQSFMENMFESVYDEEWMNGLEAKSKRTDPQVTQIWKNGHTQSQIEKYKEKVKGYTNYLIGRKISENTVPYTEEEIKSKNLVIKSPAILRILTKWCEELWEKFENESYFTERTESLQLQDPQIINPFFKWMKQAIDGFAVKEKKNIMTFKQELDRNSYSQQSQFLLKHLEEDGITSIPKFEKASGKFASHMVRNLHSYITLYLNRLIHGVLTVSKQFYEERIDKSWDDWQSPPNLITFKIGDLLRCKMSSKEKEIMKIFKELKHISAKNPKKLKIVRIKNRLKQGTNDILINVKFNNLLICQVQLQVINKSKSKFIQCSNSFSHYIYEMKRSIFGPVSELCNIWNNFEARASEYEALINITKQQQIGQQQCSQPNEKHQFCKFDLPFQCNFCHRLYYHNNYIIPNKKCTSCSKYQCVKCQISEMEEQQLKKIIFTQKKHRQLSKSTKRLKDKKTPIVGVCAKIQSNFPSLQVFQFTKYEGKSWLLAKRDGQIYSIKRVRSPKDTREFLEKYCIFQITQDQREFIDITEDMAQNFSIQEYMKEVYKQEKEVVILTQLRFDYSEMVELMKVDGGYERNKKKVKRLQFASNFISDISYFSCFENLTSINLDYNNFVNMQDVCRFKSLQKLEMRENHSLQTFNDEVCMLQKLEEIKVTNCSIEKLPQNIGNLSLLASIKMDKNIVKELPASICNILNLKEISFQRNQLVSLPEDIGKLVNLKKLILKGNTLSTVPESLGQLSSLQVLDLSQNELTSLPPNMMCLSKLHICKLANNQLTAILPTLFSSEYLKQLTLNLNKIECIPDGISACKNLQVLLLDNNLISTVPDSLGECIYLKQLTLHNNKIQVVPQSFSILTRLPSIINLSKNCITMFPAYVFMKEEVTVINLQENQIPQIPENISELQSLKILKLAHNKIKRLPQGLTKLKALDQLTIARNEITHLPDYLNNISPISKRAGQWGSLFVHNKISTFQTAELLGLMDGHIELVHNQITEIPMHLISNKDIILSINFSSNKIKSIPKDIALFTRLNQLILKKNLIQVVPKEMEALTGLQMLDLSGNPIQTVECKQFFLKVGNDKTKKLLPNPNGSFVAVEDQSDSDS